MQKFDQLSDCLDLITRFINISYRSHMYNFTWEIMSYYYLSYYLPNEMKLYYSRNINILEMMVITVVVLTLPSFSF